MPPSDYSDEEAKEILRRALSRTADENTRFEHQELRRAAEEIGVSSEEFEAAALAMRDDQAAEAVLSEKRQLGREAFFRRLGVYTIVGLFLFAITGGGAWFTYPMLIAGLFLALRAYRTFFPEGRGRRALRLAAERQRIQVRRAEEARRQAAEQAKAERRAMASHQRDTIMTAMTQAMVSLFGFVQMAFRSHDKREPPVSRTSHPDPVVTPPPRMRVSKEPEPEDISAEHSGSGKVSRNG